DGLSSTSRLAVRAAAVLGDPFEPELVGAVAQTDSARTLAAFDELIERDLVRASGARQFRFRHPLLRHVVYLSAGAGWRLGAHARAAAGLERRGGPLAAIATHLQRAANVEEAHAVEVLVAAARESASLAPA